jgi:outer membrane lipoprotein carrier protein
MGIWLALGLAAVTAWSGTDPQGTAELVRKFESRYRPARALRATFLERYFENGKLVRSEAGIAYFGRPGRMRWEYRSPEPNLYVVDGKWAWFYVPADHTTTRTLAKESSDSRTPFALLAGEMKVSRVCKSVAPDPSARKSEGESVVLRCVFRGGKRREVPENSQESSYAQFELNSSSGELLKVAVVSPGGARVEFQFSNWDFRPQIEASTFRFDVPKGVAIVNGDFTPGSVP